MGLNIRYNHLLPAWPWASCFISLCRVIDCRTVIILTNLWELNELQHAKSLEYCCTHGKWSISYCFCSILFSYSFIVVLAHVLLLSFYFVHKLMNVTFNHRILKLLKCLSSLLYYELLVIEIILFTLYLAHNKFWEEILKHKNPTSYQKFSLSGIEKKR